MLGCRVGLAADLARAVGNRADMGETAGSRAAATQDKALANLGAILSVGRPRKVISVGCRRAPGRIFGEGLDLSLGSGGRVRVRGLGSGILAFARGIWWARNGMRHAVQAEAGQGLGAWLQSASNVLAAEGHLVEKNRASWR